MATPAMLAPAMLTPAMITPAWVRMMAGYNAAMNARLYAAAARLPEAARRQDRGAFFGSLHATLCHLAWGDAMWLSRLDGGPRPPVGIAESPRLVADFAELRALREALDARLVAWAGGVGQAWLDGSLTWRASSVDRDFTRPAALVVTHVFNHQAHHRGQAHALLTAAGEDCGVTDLVMLAEV